MNRARWKPRWCRNIDSLHIFINIGWVAVVNWVGVGHKSRRVVEWSVAGRRPCSPSCWTASWLRERPPTSSVHLAGSTTTPSASPPSPPPPPTMLITPLNWGDHVLIWLHIPWQPHNLLGGNCSQILSETERCSRDHHHNRHDPQWIMTVVVSLF